MNNTTEATLKLRVWIEQDDSIYIGIGCTLLLQEIEKLGSLRKAAQELGMSYRRAWGKLKRTEERVGTPLVEKVKGQGQRFSLTDEGRRHMESFLLFYTELESFACERASELLQMNVVPSREFTGEDTE